MPTIQQLNAKYAGTTDISTNQGSQVKPGLLQKAGSFLGNAAKAVVNPVARLGVEGYNVASGVNHLAHGDVAGANAALDQPRNLPILGETKPTLTNSSRPGINQAADVAGQGIQLGADVAGFGSGSLGEGIMGGVKTGAAFGATQGAGNALTETQGKSLGQNIGNIAGQTAVGGITGGAIGGAAAGIHQIFTRPTPIMNPEAVSPYDVGAATAARETASTNAVNAVNKMNETVGADSHALGQEFKQGAVNLETSKPGATASLTQNQLEQLNNIRETKNFALPDFANTEGTTARIGGSEINNLGPSAQAQLGQVGKETARSLTPTQMQDLLTQVNRATIQAKSTGDFNVNQQLIGLRNELKDTASKAFGPEWDQIYSKYANGRTVMDKLDGIVNLDPKATPMDLNKQLNTIQKLGESPEGQKLLTQAVEAYKAERGIDLTDPVAAVNHVLKAQGQLEIAQKGSYMHQFMQAMKNPNIAARRVLYAATTILGITALGASFRKEIGKFFSGQ